MTETLPAHGAAFLCDPDDGEVERLAISLWNEGSREEALTLLERHIALNKGAAPTDDGAVELQTVGGPSPPALDADTVPAIIGTTPPTVAAPGKRAALARIAAGLLPREFPSFGILRPTRVAGTLALTVLVIGTTLWIGLGSESGDQVTTDEESLAAASDPAAPRPSQTGGAAGESAPAAEPSVAAVPEDGAASTSAVLPEFDLSPPAAEASLAAVPDAEELGLPPEDRATADAAGASEVVEPEASVRDQPEEVGLAVEALPDPRARQKGGAAQHASRPRPEAPLAEASVESRPPESRPILARPTVDARAISPDLAQQRALAEAYAARRRAEAERAAGLR